MLTQRETKDIYSRRRKALFQENLYKDKTIAVFLIKFTSLRIFRQLQFH